MTFEEFIETWERISDGDAYLQFDRVEKKRASRRDLHAFLLLDELQAPHENDDKDIVGCAGHDVIWLSIDVEKLAAVITTDQIRELVQCGVRYDDDANSLAMFV